MSDYLVPKYLYKASDFISPTKINNNIAKIMDGVTITNSDNLQDVLKSADQIQSTTTNYLNTVIPESQAQQSTTGTSNATTPTTTDSQISQCSLQQLVSANSQIDNLVNVYTYVKSLYSALQSVVNYIYNGGSLSSNSITSSLFTNNNYLCSNYTNQAYNLSDSSYLSALYPYSYYNSSNLENVLGNSNCCCTSNSSLNQYYLTSNSPIYANSAEAGKLFSITNSDYVNNYLLAPPNIV